MKKPKYNTERIDKNVTKPDNKSKRRLMREIQMAGFSAIETALYLDTHPYDKEAMAALSEFCAQKKAATERYEAEYGPITFCACSAIGEREGAPYFKWALSPMPWELEDC